MDFAEWMLALQGGLGLKGNRAKDFLPKPWKFQREPQRPLLELCFHWTELWSGALLILPWSSAS